MNTRRFTVKGDVICLFTPDTTIFEETLAGIEVQLWQKVPMEVILLGKGLTNSDGEFNIEFELESPASNIDDGKIKDVFIKAYYNGSLISPVYDDDSVLYFRQLSPSPSFAYMRAVDLFIKTLKADGNWDKLDRLWIHGAEFQQHATVSVKNPLTAHISEINSPTWTANEGYTGDGSSKYLDTNFNPLTQSENFEQNNASFGVFCRTNSDAVTVEMGAGDSATKYADVVLRNSNQIYSNLNDNTITTASNTSSVGFFVIERTNSTTVKVFKNGSEINSSSSASTGIPNFNFFILARNDDNSPAYLSTKQIALSFVGSGTIDQLSLFSAIQSLSTSLGFNV